MVRDAGFRTVINSRHLEERGAFDETRLVNDLGMTVWFQPSVSVQRAEGSAGPAPGVIREGDLLWTDFGVVAMRLMTAARFTGFGAARSGARALN